MNDPTVYISAAAAAKVFFGIMGCYGIGYGIGSAMGWVRKIVDIA